MRTRQGRWVGIGGRLLWEKVGQEGEEQGQWDGGRGERRGREACSVHGGRAGEVSQSKR